MPKFHFILIDLYTGRCKEAILSLRWNQVDLEAERINFDHPERRRTNKRRVRITILPRLMPHQRCAHRWGTDIGYVLNRDGHSIGDIKKGLAAASERSALKEVTPHTLRYTCETWLAQSGLPIWEAAGFLSMSVETFERIYGHHHPDFMKHAAEAIGSRPRNVHGIR